MYRIALRMLSGDRVKDAALILGVAFTAFLVTFAGSYFCGFMTINSEDVGDVMSILTLAIAVGFGVTGVMLYMFTSEHLRQYAVLGALGGYTATLEDHGLPTIGYLRPAGNGDRCRGMRHSGIAPAWWRLSVPHVVVYTAGGWCNGCGDWHRSRGA